MSIHRTILALGLTFLAACGGSEPDLSRVEYLLAEGRYDEASQSLARVEGGEADRLRAVLVRRVEQLERIRGEIAELRERLAAGASTSAVRRDLRSMLGDATDSAQEEELEVALSHLTDWATERRAANQESSAYAGAARRDQRAGGSLRIQEDDAVDVVPVKESTLPAELIEEHFSEKRWSAAWALLAPHSGGGGASLGRLEHTLWTAGEQDARLLCERAEALDESDDFEQGLELLTQASQRFPRHPRFRIVHELHEEFQARAELLALIEEIPVGRMHSTDSVDDAETRARELFAEDALREASTLFFDAGTGLAPGDRRDELIALSRELAARVQLRAELARAIEVDREGYNTMKLDSANETGIVNDGALTPWMSLDISVLERAARRATLSSKAKFGLVLEGLARIVDDSPGEIDAWLDRLGRIWRSEQLADEDVFAVVTRVLGGPQPADGYAFFEGEWGPADAARTQELAQDLADLAARLGEAKEGERDALAQELRDLKSEGREALRQGLLVRLARAEAKILRDATFKRLDRLAEERADLDQARESALELIFDEERYFYPYNPPDCPPEKAKLYPAVQREVDELVNVVREAWDSRTAIKLSRALRESLAEREWCLSTAGAARVLLAADGRTGSAEDWPEWVAGLDLSLERMTLATFAWDAEERDGLAYSRVVRQFNTSRWDSIESGGGADVPSTSERRQVEFTNDYRAMFGRQGLAWNAKIQVAAQAHSDYMSLTGDFGHFEKDPDTRSPFDRMRLAGYDSGASENVSMGGADPMTAHVGWIHSSGHHRNILMPGHREMASALAASYWTQNFGRGTGFQSELEGWHD